MNTNANTAFGKLDTANPKEIQEMEKLLEEKYKAAKNKSDKKVTT